MDSCDVWILLQEINVAGAASIDEATSNVGASRAAAGDTLRNPPRRLEVTPAQRQHLEGWGREFLCKACGAYTVTAATVPIDSVVFLTVAPLRRRSTFTCSQAAPSSQF